MSRAATAQRERRRRNPVSASMARRPEGSLDDKPDMNENSRCAAAFDSPYDQSRMIMRCSIYMRMGAEAERRALAYCEEERKRSGVVSPCRIVKE